MKNSALLLVPLVFLTSCLEKEIENGLTPFKELNSVADFAPELSMEANTFKGSFSDDYNTFYFFRKKAPETEKYIPFVSHYSNGKWSDPTILDYFDEENSYTYQLKVPNKRQLLFLSDQKMDKDTSQQKNSNYNFWSTEILESDFGTPKAFTYKELIYNYNSQPCIAEDGTIYFTSDAPDWSETYSYKMEPTSEGYAEPELFDAVNRWRANKDWTIFEFAISPKEDCMIICIQDQVLDNFSTDLFISFLKDNSWTQPRKLGKNINSSETENFPIFTRNGEYLLFTRGFSSFKIVPTTQLLPE
ncbi:MAG: hypothetical protein AB3N18_17815 [Allomuricauda sp.]